MAKKRLFVGLTCIAVAVALVVIGVFVFVNAYNSSKQPPCVHEYDDWFVIETASCMRNGKEQHECKICGHKEFRTTDKAAHKTTVIPAVSADCTHDGLTEGLKCSVCGEIFTEQLVIKAAHTVDEENAVVWTTTFCDYALVDSQCSRCGKQYKNQPYSGYFVKNDQALWYVNGNRIYLDGRYFTYKNGVYYAHDNEIVRGYYIINGMVCNFGENGVKIDGDITDTYVNIGEDVYYVIDNEPIKDCYRLDDDGETVYYFNRAGKRQNAIISDEIVTDINGVEYYVINNKIACNYTHLDVAEGYVAYFGADGARADDELPCKSSASSTWTDATSSGFVNIKRDGEAKQRTYYVMNNKILNGYQIIEGTVYYFGTDGVMREHSPELNDILLGLDKNTYCVQENEILKDGYFLAELDGSDGYYAYYFDADGKMLIDGEKDGLIFGEHGYLVGNGIIVEINYVKYNVAVNVLTKHVCNYEFVSIVSPRCETSGTTVRTCVCGEKKPTSESPLGHAFVGGKCLRCDKPDPNWTVEVDTVYTREGDVITFGSYPQSQVTSSSLKSTLTSMVAASDWIDYGYYSFVTDESATAAEPAAYMFYADVTKDGEKYRGVKLNDYRPYWLFDKQTAGTGYDYLEYTYQDDNGYKPATGGAIYWFKYEPITWHVIEEVNGKAFLVSDFALDSQHFALDYEGGNSNNYELSAIRSWLNDDFYNSAFAAQEASLVCASTVDNSAKSTGVSTNSFACKNFVDKVFLLSVSEVNSLDGSLLIKSATDYAKCQGVMLNGNACNWWLRSPAATGAGLVRNVNYSGQLSTIDYTHNSSVGIVPAIWIKL